VGEHTGEVGHEAVPTLSYRSPSKRSSSTTHCRCHHVSMSSFREVGSATGGLTCFSCDDDDEELRGGDVKEVLGDSAIEEVLRGNTVGRSLSRVLSRRSGGAVDGSNG
jgi:hypothetical protein